MTSYLLQKHVYACATPNAAVLLDLKADRYYGVDRAQTRALARMVEGWPQMSDADEGDTADAEEVAKTLLGNGLLTSDAARGKSAAPPSLRPASERLYEWDSARWPKIGSASILKMSVAVIRATALLRYGSLAKSVNSVWRRKDRVATQAADLAKMKQATIVYRALRPFFYSVRDKCLFDSLVLVEFLALHAMFPSWVIGVRTVPFAAHSWVQVEQFVLNSPVDVVRGYAPILAV